MRVEILVGDCRKVLRSLPADSVDCVVTSPPYFGLRDYGADGQIGLEPTVSAFVEELVSVFREVRRVLRTDGTLWLNLGDSYAGSGRGLGDRKTNNKGQTASRDMHDRLVEQGALGRHWVKPPEGLKCKDLIGIPWRVAFALQADGWWLRQDIIWSKPNPMPESVRDRCTKAHEYLFLLSKSERYYFDQDSIAERMADSSVVRLAQDTDSQRGSDRIPGKTNGTMKAVRKRGLPPRHAQYPESSDQSGLDTVSRGEGRNKRSVWTVATQPFSEAHFATYPPALIVDCIRSGCRPGGVVLDPFFGAGTTGLVANREQRSCIGIELNPEYAAIAERRIRKESGLLSHVETRAA